MKRFRFLPLVLLAVILSGSACVHPPPTITTPQGQRAYTADQIVPRVNELERAAIAAQATGGLPTETTRVIVSWCVAADQTLQATPQGWPQTLQQAWSETKAALGPISNPAVSAAMGAVDVALATVEGQ